MAVGVLASVALASYLEVPSIDMWDVNKVLAVGVIGGLLPDIDKSNTMMSNKLPGISHAIQIFVKHRGITHTAYFIAFVGGIAKSMHLPDYLIICLCGAILSHIVGDMLTPKGIAPFKILGLFDYTIKFPILEIPYLENLIEISSYYLSLQLLILYV